MIIIKIIIKWIMIGTFPITAITTKIIIHRSHKNLVF